MPRIAILTISLLLTLRLTGVARADEGASSPYRDDSPDLLPTRHLIVESDRNLGLVYVLDVWVPEAEGDYPVYFFLTGLNGLAPTAAYDETMTKIAARGVVAVLPRVGFINPSKILQLGSEFIQTLYWMNTYLPARVASELALPVRVHAHQIFVSAHSSAIKPILQLYRYMHASITGLVLIDPVNTDPYNLSPPAINHSERFEYDTPALFLNSGLGPQPGRNFGRIWPACAPEDSSTPFFYDRFSSPKWMVTALDFGHADMLEGIYLQALQASRFCAVALGGDNSAYRTFLAGAITSFIKVVIGQDLSFERYLTESDLISLRNATRKD